MAMLGVIGVKELEDSGHALNDASRIFNCDETTFFLAPKGSKVLARKGEKSVYQQNRNTVEICPSSSKRLPNVTDSSLEDFKIDNLENQDPIQKLPDWEKYNRNEEYLNTDLRKPSFSVPNKVQLDDPEDNLPLSELKKHSEKSPFHI
ncbi:unnamed protein product [Leptidea sinapis]|uniref:Uncharacterized protein n=1 Tax=Leptidea sinapis TaxID=189913 RepID=A0A5E4PXS3_9NEOP|nr:unnamed protein product [Leptidea sinapis]